MIRNDCPKVTQEIKERLYKGLATGTVHIFTAFLIKDIKCSRYHAQETHFFQRFNTYVDSMQFFITISKMSKKV